MVSVAFGVASAAILYFPRGEAIIMVAIAGAESGWDPTARGDPWYNFPPDQQLAYLDWACNDYTSFGLWQINLRWNHPLITRISGFTDPCLMALWLFSSIHNAQAAYNIQQSQGYGAWTTYNTGAYQTYLDVAEIAVDEALERPPPPIPLPGVEPPFAAVEPPWPPVEPPFAAVEPP